MYWIYLIIFILAVFSPDIVHKGLFFFDKNVPINNVRMFEELSIFILGMLGFLIFLWKEKQLKSHIAEKSKIQQKMSEISKDLKASYSYIGETNRKLEILKNIALGFPADQSPETSGKEDVYAAITEALKILGKTKKFTIRLVDGIKNNTLKEISGQPDLIFKIKNSELQKMTVHDYAKNDDYFIFRSHQKIDDVRTYIIIRKERNNQIEDTKLIETLATQALYLYALSRKVKTSASTKN